MEQETQNQKLGFFKKIWYSIDKIEKYGEMSAQGFPRAISYLFQIIIILALIVAGTTLYQTRNAINKVAQFVKDEIPNFTYSDNELKLENNEVITKEQEYLGKIIIDTNTENQEEVDKYINEIHRIESVLDGRGRVLIRPSGTEPLVRVMLEGENQEEIDKYINEISEETGGLIILKNRVIIKQVGMTGTLNYNYEDLVNQIGMSNFDKEQVIEFVTGTQMTSIYLGLFSILLMSAISVYFINTILNVVLVSIFGYLATLITKMKMRYVAILNMAIYSITLPTILQMVYVIVNQLFGIQIKYFDVMYILVSCIYMIAAIFILKSDFTKKQEQLSEVVEVQKQVKEELKENEENKQEPEKKKDKKKKEDKKQEEKEDGNEGQEPEGSNA